MNYKKMTEKECLEINAGSKYDFLGMSKDMSTGISFNSQEELYEKLLENIKEIIGRSTKTETLSSTEHNPNIIQLTSSNISDTDFSNSVKKISQDISFYSDSNNSTTKNLSNSISGYTADSDITSSAQMSVADSHLGMGRDIVFTKAMKDNAIAAIYGKMSIQPSETPIFSQRKYNNIWE